MKTELTKEQTRLKLLLWLLKATHARRPGSTLEAALLFMVEEKERRVAELNQRRDASWEAS